MLDVTHIIQSGGVLLVAFIIFAESGILAGFFLPGDTLLFTAGFFASQGKLPLGWLLFLVILAAVLGYESGYHIGKHFGRRLFRKEEGLIFRQEYLTRSQAFYEKHGGKTIVLSRFTPVVRTFAPVVAGIGNMNRFKYLIYNVAGGILWVVSVTVLGYWFGSKIPNIERYLLPVILIAIGISFGPTVVHLIREPKLRRGLVDGIKAKFKKEDRNS